ncbi:VWA domain-containing protein [Methylobrevis albus]|uniref:VWA domain-containing protein n=1 Tax=Methylobrevis albus TaxID=2793297 RepID=A0A931I6A4_9HYPH|nr:VWA domain-containing protein [Methylobrevis albus]MBH0240033.1 VWA domain-containing protein [Methylobrevis albus]
MAGKPVETKPGSTIDAALRSEAGDAVPARSSASEIDAFVAATRSMAPPQQTPGVRGRLVFALDATMSRQPTWDRAVQLQAGMFEEAGRIGGLDIQLVYFRGFDECRASRFVGDARTLSALMSKIDCRGGHTQIGKVLGHVERASTEARVAALVYVGDAMEERVDDLAARAGKLALAGVKAFMFQEGGDAAARAAFREIARLTGGAWCPFGTGAANDLARLLRAVAAYAAGGRTALAALGDGDPAARLLLEQMR